MENDSFKDSCKLFFDFFKHLTTLSTGSILLTLTLLRDVFKNPPGSGLILVSSGAFILTLLSSVLSMFFFAAHIKGAKEQQDSNTSILATLAVLAMFSFVFGLGSLAYFTYRNFP